MDINDLKKLASNEEQFRLANLVMLENINQSLDRMKDLLKRNVESLDRMEDLLELSVAASCIDKQFAKDSQSIKLAVQLDSLRNDLISSLRSISRV